MGEAINGQLGHGDRERRLRGDFCRKRERGIEGVTGFGHLLHQTPLICVRGADALVGQDHGLFGSRRPDQVQHARNALPAHVHAETDFGYPQVRVAAHDAEVQRHRERDTAADAKTFNRADRDLLHVMPGLRHPRPQLQVTAQ